MADLGNGHHTILVQAEVLRMQLSPLLSWLCQPAVLTPTRRSLDIAGSSSLATAAYSSVPYPATLRRNDLQELGSGVFITLKDLHRKRG